MEKRLIVWGQHTVEVQQTLYRHVKSKISLFISPKCFMPITQRDKSAANEVIKQWLREHLRLISFVNKPITYNPQRVILHAPVVVEIIALPLPPVLRCLSQRKVRIYRKTRPHLPVGTAGIRAALLTFSFYCLWKTWRYSADSRVRRLEFCSMICCFNVMHHD